MIINTLLPIETKPLMINNNAFVIDTNVAIVANNRNTHADSDCVRSCINALLNLKNNNYIVVLDQGMLILSEYRNYLSQSGQPGVGDYFMKWVYDNLGNISVCELVELHQIDDECRMFEEFPEDPKLEQFDRSDKKFVAVALASRNDPVIQDATDRDWREFLKALIQNGVKVSFLCPQHSQLRCNNR